MRRLRRVWRSTTSLCPELSWEVSLGRTIALFRLETVLFSSTRHLRWRTSSPFPDSIRCRYHSSTPPCFLRAVYRIAWWRSKSTTTWERASRSGIQQAEISTTMVERQRSTCGIWWCSTTLKRRWLRTQRNRRSSSPNSRLWRSFTTLKLTSKTSKSRGFRIRRDGIWLPSSSIIRMLWLWRISRKASRRGT